MNIIFIYITCVILVKHVVCIDLEYSTWLLERPSPLYHATGRPPSSPTTAVSTSTNTRLGRLSTAHHHVLVLGTHPKTWPEIFRRPFEKLVNSTKIWQLDKSTTCRWSFCFFLPKKTFFGWDSPSLPNTCLASQAPPEVRPLGGSKKTLQGIWRILEV